MDPEINYIELPSCDSQSSDNCYWDASERGNGQGTGQDYIKLEGVVHENLVELPEWDAKGYAVGNNMYLMPDGMPRPEFEQVVTFADVGMPKGPASLNEEGVLEHSQLPLLSRQSVGLDSVDNTSDMDKPVSIATQQAIAAGTDTTLALAKLRAAIRKRGTQPIIFYGFGSSTTAGTAASTDANRYFNKLVNAFQVAYPFVSGSTQPATKTFAAASGPLPAGIQGINGGVGGTESKDFISDAIVTKMVSLATQGGMANVQLMVGSNDWSHAVPPAKFKSNLQGWITKIKNAFTAANKPFVITLISTYSRLLSTAQPTAPATIKDVLPWQRYVDATRDLYLADTENIAYIDLSKVFYQVGISNSLAYDPFKFMYTDNVHMIDDGHDFMYDELRKAYQVPLTPSGGVTPTTPPVDVSYTLLSSDGFGGAASTTLANRNTDASLGGKVTPYLSPNPAAYSKNGSGQLVNGDTRATIETLGYSLNSVDQSIEFGVDALSGGSIWMDFRAASEAATSISTYRVIMDPVTNTIRLLRRLAGQSNVNLGAAAIACDWTTGHVIKATSQGSTLKLYLDGALVDTVTDTNLTTGNFWRLTSTQNSIFALDYIKTAAVNGSVADAPPASNDFTLLTSDEFTGSSVTVTDAALGGAAANWGSTMPGAYANSGGKLVPGATRYDVETRGIKLNSPDQLVEMKINYLAGASMWLDFRASGTSPTAISTYRLQLSPGEKRLYLQARLAGGTNQAIGVLEGIEWQAVHTIKASISGTTLRWYLDGVEAFTIEDTRIIQGDWMRITTVRDSNYIVEYIKASAIDGSLSGVLTPIDPNEPVIYTSDSFNNATTTMARTNTDAAFGGKSTAWVSTTPDSWGKSTAGHLVKGSNPTTSVLGIPLGTPDQEIEWTVQSISAGTIWLDFRRTAIDASVVSTYRVVMSSSAQTAQVVVRTGGTATVSPTIAMSWNDGTPHTLRVRIIGTKIQFWIDTRFVYEGTSTVISTGNNAGFTMTADSVFQIDAVKFRALNSTATPTPVETTVPPTEDEAAVQRWLGRTYRADGDSSGIYVSDPNGTRGTDYTDQQMWPQLVAKGWTAPPPNADWPKGLNTVVKNVHVGSSNVIDVANRFLTVGSGWEWKPGSYDLVTCLVGGNDVGRFHSTSAGRQGYRNGISAIGGILRMGSRVVSTTARETGSWSQNSKQYSGTTRVSTTPGSTTTIKWTGRSATMILMGRTTGAGSSFEYQIDNEPVVRLTTKNQGVNGNLNATEVPVPIHFQNYDLMEHTVVIKHTGGSGDPLIFDSLLIWKASQADMPFVLMYPPGKTTKLGYSIYPSPYATDQTVEEFRQIMKDTLLEFVLYANIQMVDPADMDRIFPGTDYSMRINDGLHPNLKGHKAAAYLTLQTLKKYRPADTYF